MGAAARAGRDAYARACLVDASERRLASRKSILREEDQELHRSISGLLIGKRWLDLGLRLFFLRPVGGFLRPALK